MSTIATTTPFSSIYDNFLSKVTDDMYLELSRQDTEAMLQDLLLNSIHWFEFPRCNLYDYDLDQEQFNIALTDQQMNILATYMIVGWLDQQLASIQNTRMKYSGSDFKFTSQANHISKLQALRKQYERIGFHMQRLYKRRIIKDGQVKSTLDKISKPAWSLRNDTSFWSDLE